MSVERTGNDLLVIASHPQELAEGQVAMIEHVKLKEAECQAELAGLNELIVQCVKMKHSTAQVKRLVQKVESRIKYLMKVRSALESGFVIVPNFPGRNYRYSCCKRQSELVSESSNVVTY